MARRNEYSRNRAADETDDDGKLWRHWGDGAVGETVNVRLQGFDPGTVGYVDVQVDANGVVQTAGGGGGGGGAVTIANGADVAEGNTADAAVITDAAGTVSGKLRGLVKWAFERMPAALGQTTMAGSLPVVLASNQSAVTVADGGGSITVDGTVAISGAVAVTGPLTDAQLRAAVVPISDGGGSLTVDGTVAVTVASGADVVQGATGDAAVVTDTTGTVNGKLRGLVKWAFERMPAALGQTTMAASLPVVLASNQTVIPVSDNGGSLTVDGPLTDAQLRAAVVPISDGAGSLTVDAPVGTPVFVRLSDGAAPITALPITDNGGSLTVDGSVTALDEDSGTGTSANVTGTGASISLIASNASRKGATIFNDSAVTAYVKLGSGASSTSFTVKMVDQSYYEVPFKYTGVIEGLWASGSIRVTELT